MKRRNILIPLDGSVFSQQIVPHILRLFDPKTHTLVLFRVAELPMGMAVAPPPAMPNTWPLPPYITARDIERARYPIYPAQEEQSTRATLEHELREVARTFAEAGFQVSVVVRFGDPAEEIANFVEAAHVDLVAMATHGWAGIRQFVLGSVAEQVLRTLDVPVVLVRPHDQAHDSQHSSNSHI